METVTHHENGQAMLKATVVLSKQHRIFIKTTIN